MKKVALNTVAPAISITQALSINTVTQVLTTMVAVVTSDSAKAKKKLSEIAMHLMRSMAMKRMRI